ncbi:hypothetical protein [Geopsychrobacter electrodiphilus]|uniref:hypothetical protein n=1 Tax=Geopsychrobacter electrodiphilus TaxID=225196 RepID=UPI00037A135B|nr:hypothetical protein [Geopsychrobacter electrodiphilus]
MRYRGMASDEVFELIKNGQRLNELIPVALKIIEEQEFVDFENPNDDEFSILDRHEEYFNKNRDHKSIYKKLKTWEENRDNCINKQTGKKRVSYSNLMHAEDAAIELSLSYGEQVPYKCEQCGNFHLSPKSNHTPSVTCKYCADSKGNSKELYLSKDGAKNRAKIIMRQKGIHLEIYECPHQSGWHLTKQ